VSCRTRRRHRPNPVKTEFGQTLDIVGVYLVLLAIIIYGVLELLHVTDRTVIWISMWGARPAGAGVRGDAGVAERGSPSDAPPCEPTRRGRLWSLELLSYPSER
jgi:hypothetical protein